MLDNKSFLDFIGGYILRHYRKRNIILYQGEVSRYAYVVKSGTIKTYTINSQGDEKVVGFYVEGDIFPSPWPFTNAMANYYYETATDAEVYILPTDEFKEFVLSHPDVLQRMNQYYMSGYTNALLRINALQQARASEKLTHTLMYLMQNYGKELHDGMYRIDLSLTQQTLASLVGLTRETIAAELQDLKKKKILSYHTQRYIINRPKLIRYLGEERFGLLEQ